MASRNSASKTKNSSVTRDKTCVLILGMHRSGTSALAGVFSKLGCELPATPMGASANNAKGFFESTRVRDLNDDLLASAGSSWDDFAQFHEDWLKSAHAREFLDRAVGLLEEEFGAARLFVLKDPRICRLVPFWTEALDRFGATIKPVLTLRNPLEVGHSLHSKKDYGEPLGQMIWLRYALDAEQATRGMTRFHTSFEQLMDGWETVAERAQDKLGLIWPKSAASVEFDVARFLSSDLKHHKESATRALTSTLLPEWLRDTYQVLNGWAKSGEMATDHAKMDQIKADFDIASRAFARLVRAERDRTSEYKQQVGELQDKNKGNAVEIGALKASLVGAQDALKAQSNAGDKAEQAHEEQLAANSTERELLLNKLADATAQQAALEQSLASVRETSQAELAAVAAETGALKESLQQQRRQATLLKAELHQLESQMLESRSELAASQVRRKEAARAISNRDSKIAGLNEEVQARFKELAILERHILRASPTWWVSEALRRTKRLLEKAFRAVPRANQPAE